MSKPLCNARQIRVRASAWVACLLAAGTGWTWAAPPRNDFPTVDRVLYVQECMRKHPGPHYEMVNKCACAQDHLAAEIRYSDYVEMSTAANANSIGGERGSYIRDVDSLQTQIKRYRQAQTQAEKACMIAVP